MKDTTIDFERIVAAMYNLPLEYKEELKSLLEHNIAEARRTEIELNYKTARKEEKSAKLKFSSSIGVHDEAL